jgi:hypothetical protein
MGILFLPSNKGGNLVNGFSLEGIVKKGFANG